MLTMGSFLEDYKKGKILATSLNTFIDQNPGHVLALGLKKIHLAVDNYASNEKTIAEVNKINYAEYEVEEQIIFLNFLCSLYINAKRHKNASSTLSMIKRLVTPDLSPEIQYLPIFLEGSISGFFEGNFKKKLEAIEKCLEFLGPKSGRYNNTFWAYLSLLCLTGEFEKFEINLKHYTALYKNTEFKGRIAHINLLKNFERGNFHVFESLLREIREDKSASTQENDVIICGKIYQVFNQFNFGQLDEKIPFDWILLSMACLLKKETEKALFWAHKSAEEFIDFKMEPSFLSYFLIRAELANKNANAAMYSLESRKKINNTCVYDDYFLFRIYHIKGDSNKAQHHFNLFIANVEKYQLNNRFEVELRLSPEISITDIILYTQNINKLIMPNQSPNNAIESTIDEVSMNFIVGESVEINQVKALVKKYAKVDTTVLIVGETGTGKELVAKALWQSGNYRYQPYFPINCGAISDHLLQSELFGHKKGAFTGAVQDHKGLFEEAGEGIVFLDEIGEISPAMQVNLLRILEAKEFRPVGSNETKQLKCKIIAATNRNLSEHVKSGHFRQDLQYRLERLTIEIPPLRERTADIPLLINHFLNIENQQFPNINFDNQAIQYLKSLPWLGNIRELKNEMERIRLFYSDKKILTIAELSNKYKLIHAEPLSNQALQSNVPVQKNDFLKSKSKFRKLEELKSLFSVHTRLSRLEVADQLKISPNTAATYLTTLEKENFIRKIILTNAKSHYYEIV